MERCQWRVHSCSSQADVHEAANVLKNELYRVWQTAQPADEAWLVLEAYPPSAFSGLEIVNAGSALLEVFGLPDDKTCEDDHQYTMLLSAQQLMSTKDVINKANRNRSFTYSCSDKLSQLATEQRWKRVKVLCRQPFGSEEHKTFIGLARLDFHLCKTSTEAAADAAEAHLQQNLKAGMAKMFPKGLSNAKGEVTSQVTEPSKHKVEHQGLRGGGEAGNLSPPRVKRRLPVWQSPSKHMKKEVEVEVDHGAVSDEEAGTISKGTESSHKQKPKGRVSKPGREESHTMAGDEGASPVSGRQKIKEVPEDVGTPSVSGRQKSKGLPGDEGTSSVSGRQKRKELPGDEGTSPVSASQKRKETSAESHKSSVASKSKGSPHQLVKGPSTHTVKFSGQSSSGDSPATADAKHNPRRQSSQNRDFSEQCSPSAHEPSQSNATAHSFSKLLDGVVFAISGLVNPERAEIRDKALQMGGQYRPDWSSDCTLLICAFANTPKFNQVKNDNGTIVSKVWIQECYQQKKLIEIEEHLMHAGNPWRKTEPSASDEFNEKINLRCEESTTLGSLRDLQQWVSEDVGRSIAWLKQREVQPDPWELESVAIQGIELCLDDTIECLKSKQSIKKVVENWEYVPRAVRELAGREEQTGKVKKKSFWSDMLSEAERLKWVYSKELEKIRQRKGSMAGNQGKEKCMVGEDKKVTDDDATDVMSADGLSDDTQVLDEEDIKEAEDAITRQLSRQHRR